MKAQKHNHDATKLLPKGAVLLMRHSCHESRGIIWNNLDQMLRSINSDALLLPELHEEKYATVKFKLHKTTV